MTATIFGVPDWFLSRALPTTPAQMARGRLLVGIELSFAVLGFAFGVSGIEQGTYGSAALCAACTSYHALALCYLRRTGAISSVARKLCVFLLTITLCFSIHAGGVAIVAGPWSLLMPAIAAYLVDPRFALRTALVTAIEILLMAWLELTHRLVPDAASIAFSINPVSVASNGIALLGLLCAIVWLNERTQRDARVALEQTIEALEIAKRQAVQSEKMAAIGRLAAGFAHEVNNPLGVILGFAQGLDRRVPDGDVLRLPVTSIAREAKRCKALVQDLLTFARKPSRTVEAVDLNELVASTRLLLEARARAAGVQLVDELSVDVPRLAGNRLQLEQVLVNLGQNALDAMPEGGTLTLRTARDGDRACIEVIDTGTGIPESVQSQIFEPFFTTKDVGRGTGLGLSIVYEIVKQHDGDIQVRSAVGAGTTMQLRLPA